MTEGRPFIRHFLFYFVTIIISTSAVFFFFGTKIMDKLYTHYIEQIHTTTLADIVKSAESYYAANNSWQGFDGKEAKLIAKKTLDYFTVRDEYGNIITTTENIIEKLRTNSDSLYISTYNPVHFNDKVVGTVTAGYFTNSGVTPKDQAARKTGLLLITAAIIIISLTSALVSALFFYRLSRSLDSIAKTANDISSGELGNRNTAPSNIKEMNQIRSSLNALGNSLMNQEKFRRELTIELSHELRTPLQILVNQTEAIMDGIYKPDAEHIEAIHSEIIRLASLLDDLEQRLIYDNENFDIVVCQENISAITKKLCVGYKAAFSTKGLAFSYDIEPDIMLKLDKMRYSQIFANLLSNALKYTASGSVSVTVKAENGGVTLSVADTGAGIEKEEQANIFKKFYSAAGADSGSGVGLYIVKLIAEKHGWDIAVKSEKGKGTTIIISANKL